MTNWTEIEHARRKAHAKHGNSSIEGMPAEHPAWLPVLVEEVGEVAHEMTYDAKGGSLRAELVDVLAVASAWLDAIDGSRPVPVMPPPDLFGPIVGPWHPRVGDRVTVTADGERLRLLMSQHAGRTGRVVSVRGTSWSARRADVELDMVGVVTFHDGELEPEQ